MKKSRTRPFTKHLAFLLIWSPYSIALADYRTDVDWNRLSAELGSAMPNGSNVIVTLTEANLGTVESPIYLPDPNNANLQGKTFIAHTPSPSGNYSGHSTSVASYFFGNSSIAPAINEIHAYDANHWLVDGQLNTLTNVPPAMTTSRAGNHSWVGSVNDTAIDSELLRRMDWLADTDEFIQCVGLTNGPPTQVLMGTAYNVLAIGRTDGGQGTGSVQIDADYTSGRTRPDLVGPASTTSMATPIVCSTATLLIQTGNENPGLSTDPMAVNTQNRVGNIINNAERSETIKAALMAGADRVTTNGSYQNITDYRATPASSSANGLDLRYGAGQVNAYNSYHILAAGEQNSLEDYPSNGGYISNNGFDYDPEFGGLSGSNDTATYSFNTDSNIKRLYASLVWNMSIDAGNTGGFVGTATLYNLKLSLFDVTQGDILIATSDSLLDNSENITFTLEANNQYRLEVSKSSSQADFNFDYSLAWRQEADQDGDGVRDGKDNCLVTTNPHQINTDNDSFGNFCDPDFDQSNIVNFSDLSRIKQEFSSDDADADLNNDETVDLKDLAIFKGFMFQAPGS